MDTTAFVPCSRYTNEQVAKGVVRVYVNGEPTDTGKRAGRALI